MKSKQSRNGPLNTPAMHILLALSESQLHGYGIMQSIKKQSEGNCRVGPGTLYANLANLLDHGWVGETQRIVDHGESRREYFLTADGERVLRAEIQRLRQIIASARRRLNRLDERDA